MKGKFNRRDVLMGGALAVLGSQLGGVRAASAQGAGDVSAAKIDWRQFAGSSIRFLGGQHPASAALQAVAPDFEALTGIKVIVEQISWNAYFQKVQLDLGSQSPQYDLFLANGGDFDWTYGPTGFISTIDQFLDDPALTDRAWYDLDDVDPKVMSAASWDGVVGHRTGTGKPHVVPFMSESYMVAGRKDLLDKYGLALPGTYEQALEAARKIHDGENGAVAGFASRGGTGVVNASLINMLPNYGGTDLDEHMNSQLASSASAHVHDLLLKQMLRPYGPAGWLAMDWTDLRAKAAQGQFAIWFDADWFAVGYEDPQQSRVAGNVVYGNLGSEKSKFVDYYFFGLAINDKSPNKKAAWLLAQYFSSKPVMLKLAVEKGLLMPTRASVHSSPDFQGKYGAWGNGTWLAAARENLSRWSVPAFMPTDQQGAIRDIWAAGAHKIYEGAEVQPTLDSVASDVNALLDRAGYRTAP